MIPKWSMDGVELGDKPGWLADLVVAAIAVAVAVVARVAIEQVVGGVTPFALTFPSSSRQRCFPGCGPVASLRSAASC